MYFGWTTASTSIFYSKNSSSLQSFHSHHYLIQYIRFSDIRFIPGNRYLCHASYVALPWYTYGHCYKPKSRRITCINLLPILLQWKSIWHNYAWICQSLILLFIDLNLADLTNPWTQWAAVITLVAETIDPPQRDFGALTWTYIPNVQYMLII